MDSFTRMYVNNVIQRSKTNAYIYIYIYMAVYLKTYFHILDA